MVLFSGSLFRNTILFLILAELFSFFGYLLSSFNTAAFIILSVLALGVTLLRFEYGILLIVAELVVGSKGFLFFLDLDGTLVSIRMALWLLVLTVWLAKMILGEWRFELPRIRTIPAKWWFVALAVFTLIGVWNGCQNGNPSQDILLDVNAWLYFLLLFPFLYAIRTKDAVERMLTVLVAAALWSSIKALLLLFVFAHDPLQASYLPLYRWVRSSGVGELTALSGSFLRVFFQSQLYAIVAFFLVLTAQTPTSPPPRKGRYATFYGYFIASILFASIILSFSRSFWLGMIAGFAVLVTFRQWRALLRVLPIGVIASCLIITAIALPLPHFGGGGSADVGRLLQTRVTQKNEAAVSSRWQLLPVLWGEIKNAPILGKGFGTSVTYRSDDPRIVHGSARGENDYTTYAFEWGYLDHWLKIGLLGVLAHIGLLLAIGFNVMKSKNLDRYFKYSVLASLVMIAVTNIFSPYLNHPLGIGLIIIMVTVIAATDDTSSALE